LAEKIIAMEKKTQKNSIIINSASGKGESISPIINSTMKESGIKVESPITLDRPTRENPYRGLIGFLRYLRGKRHELRHLDANDLWTYFTVASLYWHTVRTECRLVPLDTIKLLHPIRTVRSTAIDLLEDRIKVLTAYRRDIIETGRVDRGLQDACMPSVSPINVLAEDTSNYIAFEGNGRLVAIRRVVVGIPGVLVEVVVYYPTNHELCVGRLRHIRTMYGMADSEVVEPPMA
jgi:hypothetical protein